MALIEDFGIRVRRGTAPLRNFGEALFRRLPKGLYARSILIVVTPIVLLQSVIAYVFIERQWESVTRRLSNTVARDVAAIIEVIETYPQDERHAEISRISAETLGLTMSILPDGPLPAAAPKPFFSLFDRTLSQQISSHVGRPFWIDTVGNSDLVEIRVKLDNSVLRVFAKRSRAYASNAHIFLIWMVGTSLVLIAIALLFLRNQIRPILNLANAAERFGMGRPVEDFRPRGAREVRRASQAFIDMRERIERQIEQRTAMLSGVSHDLRTILTRFKLELAMMRDEKTTASLRSDVDEMTHMLEDYLAFARGDAGEETGRIDLHALLRQTAEDQAHLGAEFKIAFEGDPQVLLRPLAIGRCLTNLIGNAAKYADRVNIQARHGDGMLTIVIDDDGPGIPPEEREAVFKPFYRLDAARNIDNGGTGLGLAIAQDIVNSHGGTITLDESPAGGLRVLLAIPA